MGGSARMLRPEEEGVSASSPAGEEECRVDVEGEGVLLPTSLKRTRRVLLGALLTPTGGLAALAAAFSAAKVAAALEIAGEAAEADEAGVPLGTDGICGVRGGGEDVIVGCKGLGPTANAESRIPPAPPPAALIGHGIVSASASASSSQRGDRSNNGVQNGEAKRRGENNLSE